MIRVMLDKGIPAGLSRMAISAARAAATALLVGAALLALPSAESHADKLGAIGGEGGGPFETSCAANDVVIGFNLMSGSALDRIGTICIPLNAERTEWAGEAYESDGRSFGGNGGKYQKIDCQPGYAVRHFHVYVDEFGIVNHVRITCQDLDSGEWHNSTPARIGGRAVDDRRFSCPDNQWVTGIHGRHGALVDKLGPICSVLAKQAPAQLDPQEVADRDPAGKSVEQCMAAWGRNMNLCIARFGASIGAKLACEAEVTNIRQICMSLAAQAAAAAGDAGGGDDGGGNQAGGRPALVVKPVEVYDAPFGNGNKTGELAFNARVTISLDAGDDWFLVTGNAVPNGRGYVYSGADYRSLREE